ncbi:N-acyl homoserine lactonase family protein [Chishuiella sp.]|uniref:N-acyl homoserine lactonase family protein n=1 Tax=Chishuiella sp. TaxID=1969467 RepID=UPI0028ABBDEE|nr:N-acyl homoserine lactonase family protein [Chishuiella sp.]
MNNTIKVHVLHCGSVGIDDATTHKEKTYHPAPYTGILRSKKHQIIVPVSAYLIEHPKGLVLIDTGWDSIVRTKAREYQGWIHYKVSKPYLPKGQAIDEQIRKLGYNPSDIDYLILSHLHTDHVSGLRLVKDAKQILTSDIELKYALKNPMVYKKFMWENMNIRTFSFSKTNIGPEKTSFDLFGDNTLVFVHLPGHTHGMSGTLIQNNGKTLLLYADAAYMAKSWEKMIIPGITVDDKKAYNSIKWVKEIGEKSNCIAIIANHDPTMKPQIFEL